MNKSHASPRTRLRGRPSRALIWFLFFVLACNLPWAGGNSPQAQPADLFSGPVVTIQQPGPGAQITVGESFDLLVSASDANGVVRIDLYVDGTLVVSQSAPDENGITPLTLMYPLVATQAGDYVLTAYAYNRDGESGASAVHYISAVDALASTQQYAQYTVQDGDTLESIAQQSGVSVDDILKANPQIKDGKVAPGQVILVPLGPAQPVQAAVPAPGGGAQPVGQPVNPAGGNQPPQQHPAPNPANPSPSLVVKSTTVSPNPVYYGANCQGKTTLVSVTAKVEPVDSVGKVILAYAFIDSAGGRSQDIETTMQLSGTDYKADVNVGKEAEAHLAQAGGKLDLRVEAYDKDGKLSLSPIYTIIVTFCPAPQAGGNPPIGTLGQPVPGILPVFLPQPGQVPAVLPGIVPIPQPALFPVGGNPPSGFQAPTDVKATVNGCKVSLTWKDNASDETGYDVYRANPGMPAVSRIAQLPAGSTSYQETLNTFGKIMYQVAASKTEGGKILRAHSAPIYVDVPASADCSSGPKQVVIQPVSFQPSDASLDSGFVNVTIGSFSSIRIPRGQQNYQKTGDWSAATLGWTIPMPELADMKPGDQLTLEVQGNGVAGNAPPVVLGQVIVAHTYEDLTAPDSKSKMWVAKNGQMTLTYRVWLEGWKWGGNSSSVQMPVPYDLQLSDSGGNRVLTWKYDAPQNRNLTDGFIVYSTYTCGSAVTESAATAGKDPLSMNFPKDKEPVGCTCSFRVSAFGLFGESKQSEPQSGDCKTTAPEESVQVIFEKLEIKSLAQPTSADMSISANEGSIKTRRFLFPMAGVYPLGQMVVRDGNRLILNFPAGQRRSIQFVFLVANLCRGGMVFVSNDDSTWKILEQGYSMTIESLDKNCVLSLSLKSASSAAPLLKADQEGCTTSAECQSGNCQEGYCAPSARGAYGASCFANSQCTSGLCQCIAPDGRNIPCPPLSVSPPQPGYCVGLGAEGYGQACERASDCASLSCVNGACVPKSGLGQPREYCNNDSQCASDFCLCTEGYDGKNCKPAPNSLDPAPGYCIVDQSAAKNGESCQSNDECQSNYCADGEICAPRDGTGLAGDYCHHNNQCFSGSCNCPGGTDVFGFCIDWSSTYPRSARTCNP